MIFNMDNLISKIDLEEISGFFLKSAGSRKSTYENRILRPRTLNDYALLLLLEGEGEFNSPKSGPISVHAGDVLFLFPGVSHVYGPLPGGAWKEIWCIFSGNRVSRLHQQGYLREDYPVISLSKAKFHESAQVLQHLVNRYRITRAEHLFDAASVTADLFHALMLMCSEHEGHEETGTHVELMEMQQILEANILSDRTISQIFQNRSCSYHTLRKRFRELCGSSPAAYLNKLRIDRAKQLLVHSSMSVKETAFRSGFTDQLYFSRLFRNITGESPSAYRNRFMSS